MKTRNLDIQLTVTLPKSQKKKPKPPKKPKQKKPTKNNQPQKNPVSCKVCSILIDSVDCRLLILKLTSKIKIREWHLPPSCLKTEPHECQRQGSVVRNMGICLPCLWWEKGIPVMRKLGTKQI